MVKHRRHSSPAEAIVQHSWEKLFSLRLCSEFSHLCFTVVKDRVRYAMRSKFDLDWEADFYDHDSDRFKQMENRILKQVCAVSMCIFIATM